jgi:hypothetical protein
VTPKQKAALLDILLDMEAGPFYDFFYTIEQLPDGLSKTKLFVHAFDMDMAIKGAKELLQ